MIEIGRLRLQLPAGFEHRGETIARLVGQALAKQTMVDTLTLERLSVDPLQITPCQSDAQVAHQIAGAIGRQLGNRGE